MPKSRLLLSALILGASITGFSFAARPAATAVPGIPKAAPEIAAGAWAPMLKAHPRLYGSKEYLAALAKAKPKAYEEIRKDTYLMAVGVTHAVEGAPRERIDPLIGAAEVLFTGPVGGTLTMGGKSTPLRPGVRTGRYE